MLRRSFLLSASLLAAVLIGTGEAQTPSPCCPTEDQILPMVGKRSTDNSCSSLSEAKQCYGSVLTISCAAGTKLLIAQAHFGRLSYQGEMSCGAPNPLDCEAKTVNCGYEDMFTYVSDRCSGQSSCIVAVTNTTLPPTEDPHLCPLTVQYLHVFYLCQSVTDQCSVLGVSQQQNRDPHMLQASSWMDPVTQGSGNTLLQPRDANGVAGGSSQPQGSAVYSGCPSAQTVIVQCDARFAAFGSSAVDSWCAAPCDTTNPFIKVDLGAVYQVTGFLSQGRRRWNQYVSTFNLQYSIDGVLWTNVSYGNQIKSISGPQNATDIKLCKQAFVARFVRVYVESYVGYPATHIDLLRCQQALQCPPLNGSNSGESGQVGVPGTTINFNCQPRWNTTFGTTSYAVQCLSSGQWNYTSGCPVANSCGPIPIVANALHDGQSTLVGSVVNYKCLKGFVADGMTSISCGTNGQWTPSPPTCRV